MSIILAMRGFRKINSDVCAAALMLAFLCSGCTTDEAARYYSDVRYPARPSSEVQVFYEKPDREFEVIADIQAYNVSSDHMRRRAAEIGGDAVILVRGGGAYDRKEVWASADRFSNTYHRLLATVIKFND